MSPPEPTPLCHGRRRRDTARLSAPGVQIAERPAIGAVPPSSDVRIVRERAAWQSREAATGSGTAMASACGRLPGRVRSISARLVGRKRRQLGRRVGQLPLGAVTRQSRNKSGETLPGEHRRRRARGNRDTGAARAATTVEPAGRPRVRCRRKPEYRPRRPGDDGFTPVSARDPSVALRAGVVLSCQHWRRRARAASAQRHTVPCGMN